MKKALQLAKKSSPGDPKPSPQQIAEFLENFRVLHDPRHKLPSKLISMKVPVPLLEAFKFKAKHKGRPYQTVIKELMTEWLKKS